MTTEVGFCSKCGLVRQDDKFGPVTPCACFVAHHVDGCQLKIAILSPIAIPCEAHEEEECPACFPCTCGVGPAQMFLYNGRAYTREPQVGLVLVQQQKASP